VDISQVLDVATGGDALDAAQGVEAACCGEAVAQRFLGDAAFGVHAGGFPVDRAAAGGIFDLAEVAGGGVAVVDGEALDFASSAPTHQPTLPI
ncbi:MAG: hypothetical protein HYX62_06975, partial [Gammaproteobacteria bacterium]|nr:hypothetical protein [Gammaproteobacteria bacterium]